MTQTPLVVPPSVRPLPPLAVTMGDPAGIGPELIAKAWAGRTDASHPWVAIGDANALLAAAAAHGVPARAVSSIADAASVFGRALPVLAATPCNAEVVAGRPDPANAAAILGAIEMAVGLCLDGQAAACVTAPIAKAPLLAAGFPHPGHTEFLGALTAGAFWPGPRGPVMMLAAPGLRVVPVTVHCALSEISRRLSAGLIVDAVRITDAALRRDFAITAPRVAVAALNPHAGEDGAFGREEIDVIAPAVAALRALGIDARGPFPADTLFHADARKQADAIVCMYHDQALIPLKMLDFWGGVNLTLGLPIVRTSPDHGTGFDIAGTGMARVDSMMAALEQATAIATARAAQ